MEQKDIKAIAQIIKELIIFTEEVDVFLTEDETKKTNAYITEVKIKLIHQLADYLEKESEAYITEYNEAFKKWKESPHAIFLYKTPIIFDKTQFLKDFGLNIKKSIKQER